MRHKRNVMGCVDFSQYGFKCVCVCVRERERDRGNLHKSAIVAVRTCYWY